jgi:hypothetical protein
MVTPPADAPEQLPLAPLPAAPFAVTVNDVTPEGTTNVCWAPV